MIQIHKTKQLCPICHKPDFCLIAEDGKSCICARISEGSIRKAGEAGWFFILDESYKPMPVKKKQRVPINWNLLNEFYKKKFNGKVPFTEISQITLKAFNIGLDGKAYTFPMRNEKREIIGIHKRYADGKKGTEKGSQLGLFIPNTLDLLTAGRIYVCEGLSDTAAVYNLGYKVIGKPSARAGNDLVCKFVKREVIKEVGIIADNDKAGILGAVELSKVLVYECDLWGIKIIIADTKDIREDIQTYGKEQIIERLNL